MRRKKTVTMTVTVSCPVWLSAAQARREVRALINHEAFWGHRDPATGDEIASHNFRASGVGPARKGD